jgi:hypothetical protein
MMARRPTTTIADDLPALELWRDPTATLPQIRPGFSLTARRLRLRRPLATGRAPGGRVTPAPK